MERRDKIPFTLLKVPQARHEEWMRVMTPVRRLSWWSKGSEAVLVQGGPRGREEELADGLGEEIGIFTILGFGLSNWVDGGTID